MFRFKQTMVAVFLITVLSIGIFMVGCDSSSVDSSSSDLIESPNLLNRDDNQEVFVAVSELYKLDNGVSVSIYEKSILDDKNLIKMTYPVDGIQQTRIISISYSLTEAKIYDEYNNFIYGYKYLLDTEADQLTLTNWTSQDVLITTYSNSGLNQRYDLNGRVIENSYVSQDESELALYLYETYDSVSILNQSQSEQDLFFQIADINQMTNTHNSFYDNIDAEIVSYLMAHDGFNNWFDRNNAIQPIEGWVCGIATFAAAISCPFFLTGWGALICVPATGVSIGCAAQDLAEGKA